MNSTFTKSPHLTYRVDHGLGSALKLRHKSFVVLGLPLTVSVSVRLSLTNVNEVAQPIPLLESLGSIQQDCPSPVAEPHKLVTVIQDTKWLFDLKV